MRGWEVRWGWGQCRGGVGFVVPDPTIVALLKVVFVSLETETVSAIARGGRC